MGSIGYAAAERRRKLAQSTPVNDFIEQLQEPRSDLDETPIALIGAEEIGKIYCALVFKHMDSRLYVSQQVREEEGHYKAQKKIFQEETRLKLYELTNSLEPLMSEGSPQRNLEAFLEGVEDKYKLIGDTGYESGTVEYHLATILKMDGSFEEIGHAIITSAKEHPIRKRRRASKFKVFMEYHDILRGLQALEKSLGERGIQRE